MKVVCVETASERFLQHFHHFLPLHNLLRSAPLLLFAARFPATHSLFIVQHSPVATEILMAVALPDYGIPSTLHPLSVTAVAVHCIASLVLPV